MISPRGQATRTAFPMNSSTNNHYCHCWIVSFVVQIRFHKMLKSFTRGSQNPRQKATKAQLGLRTWLVLAVGVWMIYQLRVFLNHKLLLSENGSSVKEGTQIELLKLGRKGLILTDSGTRKADEEGEGGAEDMEEEKDGQKDENAKVMEGTREVEGESEAMVDGVEKGGEADDEELEMVRFDDPMEEIESLNEDDGDDDGGDNATTDKHSEGEDDKVDTKISEVRSR